MHDHNFWGEYSTMLCNIELLSDLVLYSGYRYKLWWRFDSYHAFCFLLLLPAIIGYKFIIVGFEIGQFALVCFGWIPKFFFFSDCISITLRSSFLVWMILWHKQLSLLRFINIHWLEFLHRLIWLDWGSYLWVEYLLILNVVRSLFQVEFLRLLPEHSVRWDDAGDRLLGYTNGLLLLVREFWYVWGVISGYGGQSNLLWCLGKNHRQEGKVKYIRSMSRRSCRVVR